MNEIIEKEEVNVENMIYEIGGTEVMLDSDLAKLYQVETKRINELFDKFNPNDIVKNYLFFEGDFYDAHSALLDIFNRSIEEVIIIDNYAGKELLDILREVDRKFIIVSKNISKKLKEKYEKQYNNVTFINNESFHDRFIILDRYELYLCGSSFKDLGKKCFGLSKFDDKYYLQELLEKIGVK